MGVREIILVAQDSSSYGLDLYHRRALPLLLKKLGENLPQSTWLRILYFSPYGLNDELLEVIASTPQVVKYLDIPLQHINPGILKAMHRPLDRAQIEKRIAAIRRFIPGIFLRTTFMVGFPGEDERSFQELLDFAALVRFERMGAFTYSEQEGTMASSLDAKVQEETKRERYERLMDLQRRIMEERHRDFLGREIEVILDEGPRGRKEHSYFWGRTHGDAPQVDGRVKVWVTKKKPVYPGTVVQVRIQRTSAYELEGEMV
jgi:ribosomal protein S12 methylthiotransferase